MSEQIELLDQQDVVKVENDKSKIGISHSTFQVNEFISTLISRISSSEESALWYKEGVEAKVLSAGKKWRKGKVRLTIEFISDDPDEPKSPLDDFRQKS